MPSTGSSHPGGPSASVGLSHGQALRTVARGLLGGLLGVVIDALLPDKAEADTRRIS